ncbi:MFS transporter [Paenibacillus sp. LMG 31461]|uniref:MFS transporter n=1 Tax=Paenibacillus plantarum TaxID=2654975 RepID=A0ABX1XH57_9BACL|nr:MFS transporter [Paenibacillus plantarum]NOU67857.1 MFS transporter [Paenibacillus plantarum]
MLANRVFLKLGLQMSPATKHNLYSDFGAACLFSLFNVVFNQFYIALAIRQGATNLEVGILAAAPAIGLLFSPIWAGRIEQSNPKPFVIIPNLIGRSLLLLPAFYGAPSVYVVTAIIFYFLMGIQAPAYPALITRMYQPELRGRLMGYVRVAMGAIMIPLAYLVGSWTDKSGPSGPLITAAITGVISILFLARVKEIALPTTVSARKSSFKEQLKLVRNHRELVVFFAATTLTGFGNILASPLYQIIQVRELQLNNIEIALARISYYVCLLVAYFVVGWVIDRFSAKQTLVYGLAAFAIVPLLYGIFGNYPAVIIGSGIQGIGDAIWDIGILAYIFRVVPGREAVVFGLHLMLFGIRGSIAPLISTGLSDYLPISGLLIAAAICGCIGTIVFLLQKDNKELTESLPRNG